MAVLDRTEHTKSAHLAWMVTIKTEMLAKLVQLIVNAQQLILAILVLTQTISMILLLLQKRAKHAQLLIAKPVLLMLLNALNVKQDTLKNQILNALLAPLIAHLAPRLMLVMLAKMDTFHLHCQLE